MILQQLLTYQKFLFTFSSEHKPVKHKTQQQKAHSLCESQVTIDTNL